MIVTIDMMIIKGDHTAGQGQGIGMMIGEGREGRIVGAGVPIEDITTREKRDIQAIGMISMMIGVKTVILLKVMTIVEVDSSLLLKSINTIQTYPLLMTTPDPKTKG